MFVKSFCIVLVLVGIVNSYDWYKPVPEEEGKHGCYIFGVDEVKDEDPYERVIWFLYNILKFDIDKDVIVKAERVGLGGFNQILKVEFTDEWPLRQITIKKYLLDGQDKYRVIKFTDLTVPEPTPPPSYHKW